MEPLKEAFLKFRVPLPKKHCPRGHCAGFEPGPAEGEADDIRLSHGVSHGESGSNLVIVVRCCWLFGHRGCVVVVANHPKKT